MMKTNDHFLTIIRWIARISGLLLVAFTIFMAVGYSLEERQRHPNAPFLSGLAPLVIVTFIVWGLGLVGLLLGWWKEKQGGILSLACFILVFILSLFNSGGEERPSSNAGVQHPVGPVHLPLADDLRDNAPGKWGKTPRTVMNSRTIDRRDP